MRLFSEETPVIHTERLTVRRIVSKDAREIGEIWAALADTEFAQYDTPKRTDPGYVRQVVSRWAELADSETRKYIAVCLEDHMIGFIVLYRQTDTFELGYAFHPGTHGKGYAFESISAVLDILKRHHETRVTAGTALKNESSVRLLLRLGFQMTATERVSFYSDAGGSPIYFDGGVFECLL